ncbi:hypothetical protein Peur_016888 [Populus x canadensis]
MEEYNTCGFFCDHCVFFFVFLIRFWGLEWILMIHCLQFCSFLTTKGLYLMMEWDCKDFVPSIKLSYQMFVVFKNVQFWVFKQWLLHKSGLITKILSYLLGLLLTLAGMGEGMSVIKEKYRILQRGDSVKSDLLDIMVHPSDVFGPSIPGPIVFIVDCPTESHARVLLSSESLNGYYSNLSGNPPLSTKVVNCIIHLTPASAVSSPSYEKWIQKLYSAQHVMAGHAM